MSAGVWQGNGKMLFTVPMRYNKLMLKIENPNYSDIAPVNIVGGWDSIPTDFDCELFGSPKRLARRQFRPL